MNTWWIFVVFAATDGLVDAQTIAADKIVPFKQPKPVTTTDQSGVMFKPTLLSTTGCQSYAAIDAEGRTNEGAEPVGMLYEECEGSDHGSQVYGRAMWHKTLWAIMYAWYFPKNQPFAAGDTGHRHDWSSIVIWIDNPKVLKPRIIGVATWFDTDYKKYNPLPPGYLDGNATRVQYILDAQPNNLHHLDLATRIGGVSQDLIMWDQIPKKVQDILSKADFGENISVPFIDKNFEKNLALAWLY